MRRFLTIFMGVLMVIGGFFCLFSPVTTFLQTGYIIGVIIFCDAIGNIIAYIDAKKYSQAQISGWYLVDAIISLIFGIAVIVSIRMQFAVDMVVVYIIAWWVVIIGISRIALGVRIKKLANAFPEVFSNKRWLAIILFGVLMIVFGILCMFKPIILSSMLGVMIAILIICAGANLITLGTYFIY